MWKKHAVEHNRGTPRGGLREISLDSFNYGTKPPNRVVDVRRSGVGWIFQDFHLVDRLDALDNVAFSLELSGMSSSEAEGRAMDALTRVGLADGMNFIPINSRGAATESRCREGDIRI